MPKSLPTLALAAAAAATLIGGAWAQSGDTSGAMSAQMQSQTSADTTGKAKPARRSAKKPPSTDMNTTGSGASATPTGPFTSTDSSNGASDISGATGASITQPAAPAPPGVAPPGGAPDTGGGEAPNVDGGPH